MSNDHFLPLTVQDGSAFKVLIKIKNIYSFTRERSLRGLDLSDWRGLMDFLRRMKIKLAAVTWGTINLELNNMIIFLV